MTEEEYKQVCKMIDDRTVKYYDSYGSLPRWVITTPAIERLKQDLRTLVK